MQLGKLGMWVSTDMMSAPAIAALAARAEAWGYSAFWVPEGMGRNALVTSSWILSNTKKLVAATGIANIYARDPVAAVGGQYALAEHSGGRFLLGLGVSHAPIVEGVRHQDYKRPIETMRSYLEAMAKAQYSAPMPGEKPKTVIAALGPKMLEVAAQFCDGAHPYNVTPEHTAQARKIMGPGKLLYPEQMILLEKDPVVARGIGRRVLAIYLTLPNYLNNLKRLGFKDQDFEQGGSDRLIDAMVAWGDEGAIRSRIQQHWDAGADHVCIQSLPREGKTLEEADVKIFELLAPSRS